MRSQPQRDRSFPEAQCFVQTERRGTAHAVLAAKAAIARGADDILVVYGDTPLISPETLARLRAPLARGAAVAVLGFRPRDPAGYGRLIVQGDDLIAIREEADASASERAIDSLQWRPDGACRQPGARDSGTDRG